MRQLKYFMIMLMVLIAGCSDSEDKDGKLYFAGDSIIARWPLSYTFPSRLVYDFGLSGAGIDYISRLGGRFRGNDVVVIIGTNNYNMFVAEHIDSYVAGYLEAVSSLTDRRVYLFSVLPREFAGDPADVNQLISRFNAEVKSRLQSYPDIIYLDVYDDFMSDGHINYQYYSDGLHLNIYGYELLSYYLLKQL